jgi:hypothetical protein
MPRIKKQNGTHKRNKGAGQNPTPLLITDAKTRAG